MKKISLTALALALATSMTNAQVAEPLDTVNVGLMRDPGSLPFGDINVLLSGFQRHGGGLLRMDFKLQPKDRAQPFPIVPKLALQSADGTFDLPVLPTAEARDAHCLALTADPKDRDPNTPKGQASKPCTSLSDQETWPDEVRLIAPADAELTVCLAGQAAAR